MLGFTLEGAREGWQCVLWGEPLLPLGCHQGMSPSCSTPRAALVLHLSFLGSQNPVAGPSACSRCVEQRVGGAAVLLQLQWQQGRVGSHPRVFGPLLSFWYLLKISWGLFF